MPVVSYEKLNSLSRAIFSSTGIPEEDANILADHLTNSNLLGHDSHGVWFMPRYVPSLRSDYRPWEDHTVIADRPGFTQIDGNGANGIGGGDEGPFPGGGEGAELHNRHGRPVERLPYRSAGRLSPEDRRTRHDRHGRTERRRRVHGALRQRGPPAETRTHRLPRCPAERVRHSCST